MATLTSKKELGTGGTPGPRLLDVPFAWFVFVLALLVAVQAPPSLAAPGPNTLSWNTNRNRVTADITGGQLVDVLKRVASRTGWQVFLEPGTEHRVSAKFADLSPGEALRLLLGDINFALIPLTNGPSRLLVFRTGSQNATQQVRPEPAGARRIANELVVRLKPGASIDEVAKVLGAKVVGRIDKLNLYRLEFSDAASADAAREELVHNPGVGSVEDNYAVDRTPTQVGTRGGGAPLQLQMRPPPESGRVVIGLIDTAVQPLGNNLDQFVLKQISVAGPSQVDPNFPLHGTAMAETMLRSLQDCTGGSTSVQILPIDVYGSGESTSTFSVAQGIVAAVNGGARVINLSLGSEVNTPFLRDVVRSASQSNVLLIGAAGNVPVATPFYPAAYPEVRAVTAIEQGQIASYASRGDFVSLGGPSMNFIDFANQSYGVQGTSVSSAYVSGAAAGFMEVNRANAAQAGHYLDNNFGLRGTR